MRLFYTYLKLILIIGVFVFSSNMFGQENCGNGIDDDGDGKIDCLDPDCLSDNVPSSALFNTASDGNGGVLSGGSNDNNWQISIGNINGPYAPAIVMSSIPGSYYSSPWTDCNWISHSSSGSHSVNDDFYYKINFDLPCYRGCGQPYSDSAVFCITMDFFADNSVDEIYVNGTPQSHKITGVPNGNPYGYVGFKASAKISTSLCANWQAGTNELIVKVSSGPGFEGFLAQYSTSISDSLIHEAVGELIIPNVFTPNGDDNNDLFEIAGVNNSESYSIKIFNRWGNKVFEETDPTKFWDGGTHKEGVFFYEIQYYEFCKSEQNIKTGYVTLLK